MIGPGRHGSRVIGPGGHGPRVIGPGQHGAVMVCGTASHAGKSLVVAGLCRLLGRAGVRVAPYKAQNMALNSCVTRAGHEIGRAQWAQALAAGAEPEAAMNPVLLKPTGERTSQVVVMGRPAGHVDAASYEAAKPHLRPVVEAALADLRARFEVVVLEGAGSPAEPNLWDHDIVNLPLAEAAGIPALVVGDIDRGGAFAALYGTVAILPARLRASVRAFVVNKFRGDPALLGDALGDLERRTGVPCLGVLPWVPGVGLDAEDSLSLEGAGAWGMAGPGAADGQILDVAVVRFPRISNFTDLDPLGLEPGVAVRLVDRVGALGRPDLVVLPGTKATVDDLGWLRARGLDRAVASVVAGRGRAGATVLGICGGYQMLGRRVLDGVESGRGEVGGLGWLDVETVFAPAKLTRRRRGGALGRSVAGYEIRHGRIRPGPGARPWIRLDDAHGLDDEGARDRHGAVLGTSVHGLFEADGFRRAFLAEVASRAGKRWSPGFSARLTTSSDTTSTVVRRAEKGAVSLAAARRVQADRLADLLEAHLDLEALGPIIEEGR